MNIVVCGRFDIENLAIQLITDTAGYLAHQQTKSISDDYQQSQKASRGAGHITQTTIEQQWENQLINDAEYTANTQLPSVTFDVNNSYVSQRLGQRVGEEVSHFYHPTPPPRNPSGFWRGVDNVLKMREGTINAISSVFTGNYEAPQDPWQKAGYVLGEALENRFIGGRVIGNVQKLERLGFFAKQVVPETAVNDIVVRRAYLNEKFGRTGDLHTDITLRGYLNQAGKLDVSTAPNAAVFYSGDFGANKIRAEEFSRLFNKTTLEMTPGGSYLDNQHIGLILPEKLSIQPWQILSERYAQSASGETFAFVRGAGSESIFKTIELPALLKNPNVTDIFERETPYLYETARINYAP